VAISAAVPIGPATDHTSYVSAPTTQGWVYINARERVPGYTDYTFTKLPMEDREAAVLAFIEAHGGENHPRMRRDGTVIEHRVRISHG